MAASRSSPATGATAWGTALSETSAERIAIRGYDITELIGTIPFSAVVHLLYTGELPNPSTARLVDAVMVASIDHGAGAPSALAARTAISGGASLPAGAAAGLLSLGEFHGAAVDAAMEVIATVVDDHDNPSAAAGGPDYPVVNDRNGRIPPGNRPRSLAARADEVVRSWRDQGRRVPGFGHRQHRQRDPRLDRLFAVAHEVGVAGDHLAAAEAVEVALKQSVGRPVPINIDGAMAALLGEVGFPSNLGNALFVAARVAGIVAHANEERHTMPPMRRIDPVAHTYHGPPSRPLPHPGGEAPSVLAPEATHVTASAQPTPPREAGRGRVEGRIGRPSGARTSNDPGEST